MYNKEGRRIKGGKTCLEENKKSNSRKLFYAQEAEAVLKRAANRCQQFDKCQTKKSRLSQYGANELKER